MAKSLSDEFSDLKQVGKGAKSQKTAKDLGEEVVTALEKDAAQIREDYRPLTPTEKARLKTLIDLLPACKPERGDIHIINRLVDVSTLLEDEELESSVVLILLGVAYERMRSQTSKH